MGVERALSSKGRYRVGLKREWDLGETPKLNVERSPFELRVRMSIFEKKEKNANSVFALYRDVCVLSDMAP